MTAFDESDDNVFCLKQSAARTVTIRISGHL
jgi:hypothetical protein